MLDICCVSKKVAAEGSPI